MVDLKVLYLISIVMVFCSDISCRMNIKEILQKDLKENKIYTSNGTYISIAENSNYSSDKNNIFENIKFEEVNQTYNLNGTNPISEIASNIDKGLITHVILNTVKFTDKKQNLLDKPSEENFDYENLKNFKNTNNETNEKMNLINKKISLRRFFLISFLSIFGSLVFLLVVYLDKNRTFEKKIFNNDIKYNLLE